MNIPTTNLVFIEVFHNTDKNSILWRRKNHDQFFILHVGASNTTKQINCEIVIHIRYNRKLKIRIIKSFSNMCVKRFLADAVQHLPVLNRQPRCGSKLELVIIGHCDDFLSVCFLLIDV